MTQPPYKTLALLIGAAGALLAWQAAAPVPFTNAQATAGKPVYERHCAECHGEVLDNGEFAPPLRGAAFTSKWAGRPADELLNYINTRMPPSSPGVAGPQGNAQMLAYILGYNGFAPGQNELTAASLRGVNIPQPSGRRAPPGAGPSGGLSDYYKEKLVRRDPPNPFTNYAPVTDAMLAAPAEGEWLTWRRSADSSGFSPLKQINRTNVSELRTAWGFTLSAGPN